MKLSDVVQLRGIEADGSTGEWFEYYYGTNAIPTHHPPSLKNPARVRADMPTDGWHDNDSPALKKRARQDLHEIMKRVRRQTGKPEVTRSAAYPIFPSIQQWT
jgi:hypothetical protein